MGKLSTLCISASCVLTAAVIFLGFPTTQVVERINRKAAEMAVEKREYQEAEVKFVCPLYPALKIARLMRLSLLNFYLDKADSIVIDPIEGIFARICEISSYSSRNSFLVPHLRISFSFLCVLYFFFVTQLHIVQPTSSYLICVLALPALSATEALSY